jgi:hypothetical protein
VEDEPKTGTRIKMVAKLCSKNAGNISKLILIIVKQVKVVNVWLGLLDNMAIKH